MKKIIYYMRKILIIVIGLTISLINFIGCSINEEPNYVEGHAHSTRYITPEDACMLASEAIVSFGFDVKSRSARPCNVRLYSNSFYPSRLKESDSTFYIVDYVEGGFAIIAAEKGVSNPIYAITDSGSFDVSSNLELQLYIETMASWTKPVLPYDSIKGDIAAIRFDSVMTHCERYVPVDWNQNYPYNQFCPFLKDGSNALTGCAAVAMGQVMAFHRLPDKIDSYTLQWDSMLVSRRIFELGEEGKNDISYLLAKCGELTNSNYDDEYGTATKPNAIPAGFAQFGYENSIWVEGIAKTISSLKDDGPVLMVGYKNVPIRNGHIWVVDAEKTVKNYRCLVYDDGREDRAWLSTDFYFHMNWGHGGRGNAFYRVIQNGPNDCEGYDEFQYLININ